MSNLKLEKVALNLNKTQIKTKIIPHHTCSWSPNCIWRVFAVFKVSLIISLRFSNPVVSTHCSVPLDYFPVFIQQKKVPSAKCSSVYYFQIEHLSSNSTFSLLYNSLITSISKKTLVIVLRTQQTHFCLHSQTPTPASTPPNLSIYNPRQEMCTKLVMLKRSFLTGNLV